MIEQPSSVPTNKEIAQAQEAARHNVTVLEAEAVRLDRIISSQKREIIVHEGAKKDIEDLIELVEGKLAILETQLDSSEQSLASIIEQVNAASKLYADTKDRTEVLSKNLDDREAAVAGRELKLAEAEADLKTRNSAFEVVRDHHFEVVDRVKQAITAL